MNPSAHSPTPKGPGSVSGAPNLPVGFADMFTGRYVEAGGVRLHAVTGGNGPPLLLVHGWPRRGTPGARRCRRSPKTSWSSQSTSAAWGRRINR
jgi:hypothetical protein